MRTTVMAGLALCLAIGGAGCGDDDNFSPTVETVAGSYTATTFTLEGPGGTADLLALGATVSVNLAENGTTTGTLFIPDGNEDGSDLDASLAGTWTLSGNTVSFSQSEDTFIRDVDFAASPNRLTGEGSFDGAIVLLVLTKDE